MPRIDYVIKITHPAEVESIKTLLKIFTESFINAYVYLGVYHRVIVTSFDWNFSDALKLRYLEYDIADNYDQDSNGRIKDAVYGFSEDELVRGVKDQPDTVSIPPVSIFDAIGNILSRRDISIPANLLAKPFHHEDERVFKQVFERRIRRIGDLNNPEIYWDALVETGEHMNDANERISKICARIQAATNLKK